MSSLMASQQIFQPSTKEHERYNNIEDSDEASSKSVSLHLPNGGAADVASCDGGYADQGKQNTSD